MPAYPSLSQMLSSVPLQIHGSECSVFVPAKSRISVSPIHTHDMLESTFIFLNGVGETTERLLWSQGILHWQQFLDTPTIPGLRAGRKPLYDETVQGAWHQYQAGNWRHFSTCLKSRDHWRLFDTFRSRTVFLDIETTGDPAGYGEITLVGLFGRGTMTTLIHGETLTPSRLQDELDQYDLIVSFFGTGFDLPYLRTTYPGLHLPQAHFDLCFAARRLGLRGGLKHIESEIGLSRSSEIRGLDGWDAVRLWHAWQAGDQHARSQLCAYNEADVRNLVPLAQHIYERLFERYGPATLTTFRGRPG